MSSTSSLSTDAHREQAVPAVVRWQSWPLAEYRQWSWVVPAAILAIAGTVTYVSGNWLWGLITIAALAAAFWQFLLPVTYEVCPIGFRRMVLGRTRLVPWHAVRAYRVRATGVVLYQRPDPTPVDALRSLFLPYPTDEDEVLCAVREYLGHAVELPTAT